MSITDVFTKFGEEITNKRMKQIGQVTSSLGTVASVHGALDTSKRLAKRVQTIGDREATIRGAQARQLRGEQIVTQASRGGGAGSTSQEALLDQSERLEFQDVANQRFIQDAIAADITARGQSRALAAFGVDFAALQSLNRQEQRINNPFFATAMRGRPGSE